MCYGIPHKVGVLLISRSRADIFCIRAENPVEPTSLMEVKNRAEALEKGGVSESFDSTVELRG